MDDPMKRFVFALTLLAGAASLADAGPFHRRGRSTAVCVAGTCQQTATAKPATATQAPAKPAAQGDTSTAQGVALLIVNTGRFRHWGGNPFAAEGIGMGPTPAAALQNCCFYGRRSIADVGYAQMSNGQWVAVARYR